LPQPPAVKEVRPRQGILHRSTVRDHAPLGNASPPSTPLDALPLVEQCFRGVPGPRTPQKHCSTWVDTRRRRTKLIGYRTGRLWMPDTDFLDSAFFALAAPTRRAILARLASGTATVTE